LKFVHYIVGKQLWNKYTNQTPNDISNFLVTPISPPLICEETRDIWVARYTKASCMHIVTYIGT